MKQLCNYLLTLSLVVNVFYSYIFPFNNTSAPIGGSECIEYGTVDVGMYRGTDHNPDLTFYGGDTYYIKGNRLYTESGEVDTVFNTKKELSIFLEEHSAKTYKEAIMWEMRRTVTDYSSVMVFNDGEITFNFCSPYEDVCEEIILSNKDCDNYGSCLYYSDPQQSAGNIKPLNR